MPKDLPASVRQKLLNKARRDGRPFDELLQYFVIERFLYRLSSSRYKSRFVLKGALLFRVWTAEDSRATRDIDFLVYAENSISNLVKIVSEILAYDAKDGVVFDPESIQVQTIKEGTDYEGTRIIFRACLERAIARVQLDIAFGDVVNPEPTYGRYPTLLGHAAPEIRLYPPETVIAEKLEAMIYLSSLNSRMKDFYDLWRLSQQFEFDGALLTDAITQTLSNRNTETMAYPELKAELTKAADKQKQWAGFLEKSQLDGPEDFGKLLEQIGVMITPVLDSILNNDELNRMWTPGGPWKTKKST